MEDELADSERRQKAIEVKDIENIPEAQVQMTQPKKNAESIGELLI
jgi:hypothetical protein